MTPTIPNPNDGLACVVCGLDFAGRGVPSVPVGRCAETGSQVFACASCCGEDDRDGCGES